MLSSLQNKNYLHVTAGAGDFTNPIPAGLIFLGPLGGKEGRRGRVGGGGNGPIKSPQESCNFFIKKIENSKI